MRFLSKLLILCLVLLCYVSCSSNLKRAPIPTSDEKLHKTIYIDRSFSKVQVEFIEAALNEWSCSTNRLIKYEIVKNTDYQKVYDTIVDSADSLVLISATTNNKNIKESDDEFHKKDNNTYTLGLYMPTETVPTILVVSDRIYDKTIYVGVLLHELGHAWGLGHFNNKDSVMYYNITDGSKHITKNDLYYLCYYYWCKPETMNICSF